MGQLVWGTAQQQGKILPQGERKSQYQRVTSDLHVYTFVIHVPFMEKHVHTQTNEEREDATGIKALSYTTICPG